MVIKWSKGMAKEWKKIIYRVCGKIMCKTKVYKFVEKLGTKICAQFWQKSFVENCVEKLVGRVGWGNWVKGVGEKSC